MDLVNEILGTMWHEDTITPGRTASVHVLGRFSVLFTVGVAERQSDREFKDNNRGESLNSGCKQIAALEVLPGWKFNVLFPNNIMKGRGFFVIFQKLKEKRPFLITGNLNMLRTSTRRVRTNFSMGETVRVITVWSTSKLLYLLFCHLQDLISADSI